MRGARGSGMFFSSAICAASMPELGISLAGGRARGLDRWYRPLLTEVRRVPHWEISASASRVMPPNASCVPSLSAAAAATWTFAGSDAGGRKAAAFYTLIATAKLNDIDLQAWLADVFAGVRYYPASGSELLRWNWHTENRAAA